MEDYQIFISYRRDGGEHLAGRLADKLKEKGYTIFFDVESMRSGTFNTQIFKAIDSCKDFLLILPPKALDRCKDPEDWVRLEIAYALRMGKNIIPVMMRDFVFPSELPRDIEKVRFFEGVTASSDYFDACVEKIIRLLKITKPHPKKLEGTGKHGKIAGMMCGVVLLAILLAFGIGRIDWGKDPGDVVLPNHNSTAGTQLTTNPVMDAKYQLAMNYVEEGNHGAAAIAYASCGDYLDAVEQCDLCWEKLAPYNHNTITDLDNCFVCILPDGTIPKEFCYFREMSEWTDLISLSGYTALRADGTVLVPKELGFDVQNWDPMVMISQGEGFLVGLRKDGTVAITGNLSNGRQEVESWTDIVSVKAGVWSGCIIGLKSDGTAVIAGADEDYWEYPLDVSHWKNIQKLCAEEGFAVDKEGRVYYYLSDAVLQETSEDVSFEVKKYLSMMGVVDIIRGWCLLQDGTLVCTDESMRSNGMWIAENWQDIVSIAGGWYYISGLRADGTILNIDLTNDIPFYAAPKAILPTGDTHMEEWNLVEAEFENYTMLLKLMEDGSYQVRGFTGAGMVELPEKYQYRFIDSIGSAAFYGSEMTGFKGTWRIRTVGAYAFAECTKLETVDFGLSSVQICEEGVFYGCKSLQSIHNMDVTNSVGDYAFYYCESLTDIPDTYATHIGRYAFSGCSGIQELILSHGMVLIREGSFSYMDNLRVLCIPDTVEEIEVNAFAGCCNLQEIHYAGTVKQWRELNLQPEDFGIYKSDVLTVYCQDGTV